jgi:hypothetical protein
VPDIENNLLSLDSPEWTTLDHAYGKASDIPDLLRQLSSFPSSEGRAEPWFTIWSALAHQGDVYSASFAAVPHVIRVLATAPTRASYSYFSFPAWVEICRHRHGIRVPVNLQPAYDEALSKLPALAGAAAAHEWNSDFLACVLSAVAAAKGFPIMAEAVLEMSPKTATEFLSWFSTR